MSSWSILISSLLLCSAEPDKSAAVVGQRLISDAKKIDRSQRGPNTIFSARPTNLIFGELILGYERRLVNHLSIVVSGNIFLLQAGIQPRYFGFRQAGDAGFGADIGLRYWLSGRALRGFFVGAQMGASYVGHGTDRWNSRQGDAVVLLAKSQVGYQWILGGHAALTLGAGSVTHGVVYNEFDPDFRPLIVTAELMVGVGVAF